MKSRRGFTLAEVLVTVAIVSVIAAIVVPTMTSQISKGDDARAAATVSSIRVGAAAFLVDVRRLPGRLSQLFNPIETTPMGLPEADLFGAMFDIPTSRRWKGPYTSGALVRGDSLAFASSGYLRDSLIDSNLVSGTSGFLVATVSGITTQAAAARLDSIIDAASGSDVGMLQWSPAAGAIPAGAVKLQIMRTR